MKNANFIFSTLAKRDCPSGKVFNRDSRDCEYPPDSLVTKPPTMPVNDDPFLQPQFQAPDDICSGGVPLTKLGAPVACNPQISSCPDGYACILYSRTGTSYCCQTIIEPSVQDGILCAGNQVTYFEPLTGVPKTCALTSPSTCPVGFGCNLVGGSLTRCCGKDFGCPLNSAGFVNPNTGSHVQCNVADPTSCPNGFICMRSSMFSQAVCCSDTSVSRTDVCGGDSPLASPNPCSAISPCPGGYNCRNGRCCPAKGMCPTGSPLGGLTSCSPNNPCPNNYQCVTNNGAQYCCPAPEHVCGLPKDSGRPCEQRVAAVARYYFDVTTGSCRAFQYSQCGGNANNFDSLDQCQGFCLESQCPVGSGLKAGPSMATCQPGSSDSCPMRYNCMQPLFGMNYVCCSNKESICRDSPSAGTACFGSHLTIQRYRLNPDNGQCEPFQYYGCHGSSNNFITKQECQAACQPTSQTACNGVAPMSDDNGDYVKRCAANVPCPKGSWCNTRGYCCPHAETSCNAPKSIGHTCLTEKPGTYWYYDSATDVCLPFAYSGCGGTTNRFTDRSACEQQCINKLGECPRGMAPFLTSSGAQRCNPHISTACPEGTSCVKSSTGEDICCSSTAQCPTNRLPYIIPGSDSHVACLPDDDNCPQGFQCVQSGTVQGFYMCCSGHGRRLSALSVLKAVQGVQMHAPKCPSGLQSNGQRCTVNEIESCPTGYLCLGNGLRGVCCKTQPKCQKKRRPYYIAKKQVLTCGDDESGCPRGSVCTASTLEGVDICCVRGTPTVTYSKVPKVVPKCKDGSFPYFALGSRVAQQCSADRDDECPEEFECDMASDENFYCCPAWDKCPGDSTPFLIEGSRKPLGCNWAIGNCPSGYTCEGSVDRAICCKGRPSSAQCPAGQTPFLYAKRPLVCPPGKKSCPNGYDCVPARNGGISICCSTVDHQTPECVHGYVTNRNQICDPQLNTCPAGHTCTRSTMAHVHVCCTNNQDSRFDGYCPPGQVPLTSPNSLEPPTCHMVHSPCPTSAAYQCVYSAEKQNSYCCAPVDTTALSRYGLRHYHQHKTSGLSPYNSTPNPYGPREFGSMILTAANGQTKPMLLIGEVRGPQQPLQILTVPPSNLISSNTGFPMGQQLGQQVATSLGLNANNLGQVNNQNFAQLPNAAHIVASCPPWSKPLLNMQTKTAQTCSTWNRCPSGFTCYSNHPDGRNAQCCTTVPLDNQVVFRANPQLVAQSSASEQPAAQQLPQLAYAPPHTQEPGAGVMDEANQQTVNNSTSSQQHSEPRNVSAVVVPSLALPMNVTLIRCPLGTVNISGVCKRMFFVGQHGCENDQQCNQRTNGTICTKGYCSCTEGKLIHESKCVQQCPEGFLNIASRCHDLTTIVFMDSVDDRANGTIGGFCLETVIREEQCNVENAYCNERSITCQCKPGYELQMNFEDRDDKGTCVEMAGSKFSGLAAKDTLNDEMQDDDVAPIEHVFYVIDGAASQPAADPVVESGSGVEPLDLNATLNDTSIHVRASNDDAGTAVEILTKV
ncbi:hypothetical protein M3Y94_00681500 [Aphelenchoides besseyi]|nr:hypothetical protein M3Y94_00681500 [Aphelenchoides besseyi]